MRRTLAALVLTLLIPRQLPAKGSTIRITVNAGNLSAPIVISDPAVTGRFNVWTGPGTSRSSNGTLIPIEGPGLIVDWPRGVAEPPKGLPIYTVSFLTSRSAPNTYIVRYVVDPVTNEGYVYIPGKTDPEYRDNTWLILRGVEGQWFHAWSAWERIAHPLIAASPKR